MSWYLELKACARRLGSRVGPRPKPQKLKGLKKGPAGGVQGPRKGSRGGPLSSPLCGGYRPGYDTCKRIMHFERLSILEPTARSSSDRTGSRMRKTGFRGCFEAACQTAFELHAKQLSS